MPNRAILRTAARPTQLTMNRPFELVRNHEAVIARIGVWPTFHDAEVISFRCDRSGPFIESDIHVWNQPADSLDHEGHFVRTAASVVTIRFLNMRDLTLDGFNWQNVLDELAFDMTPGGLRITLHIHCTDCATRSSAIPRRL